MRAIVIHAAQDLRIEDRPVETPGPGQIGLRLATGGVCGSDLHYYNHGGFGAVRLREPMILGHEVSAFVETLGPGVTGFTPGQLVAVSPSRPCGGCKFCLEGLPNQCLNMRFYGSAMPFPHIQGAFRESLVADASQCIDASGLTAGEAAMAEPLAVTLHATTRAGGMLGKRVLVTGCGPIGVLSIIAARRAGAPRAFQWCRDPWCPRETSRCVCRPRRPSCVNENSNMCYIVGDQSPSKRGMTSGAKGWARTPA